LATKQLRIGLVVPHIFMHREILPRVIFAPAKLAFDLCEGLERAGAEVTLFSPGPVDTGARNITADLSYFEQELAGRGDSYIDLLKKHSFTFVTLARQVQAELIAKAFDMANRNDLDIIHIYTNEEDIALPFAKLCTKPVVFTHHDPFNFLVKYKNVFPKYKQLNWISMSLAQRAGMPPHTNWVGNVYHGLDEHLFHENLAPEGDYVAYFGRIIEPKGVHLAIEAVKLYNKSAKKPLKLKIAGKHYAGHKKDTYWQERIEPLIDGTEIEYLGFLESVEDKQAFLGNAQALIVPSVFDEPFGMVIVEALACGTPILGLSSGAIPEVVQSGITGEVVQKITSADKKLDESATAAALAEALPRVLVMDRKVCRQDFEARFTAARMVSEHLATYAKLTQ
jgi:glycosyltransferase involved in cell wall biosynthesis